MTSVSQKLCIKCGEYYPATNEFFSKNSVSKDKLYAYCKTCSNIKCKIYAEENKLAIRNRNKEHRKTNKLARKVAKRNWYVENKEYCLQYSKDYFATHKEERRAYDKIYHENHRPHIRERDRRKYANNPTRQITNYHKRRARKSSHPDTLTSQEWANAIEYFYGCCAVCGRQARDLFSTHRLAMDHWIPLSSNDCPGTVALNIIPLCHGQRGCNNRKKDRDPVEFVETEFGKRKAAKILRHIETYFRSLEL